MKHWLLSLLLAAVAGLGTVTPGCRYWAGPLPLGARNDVRLADTSASHRWAEPVDVAGVPNLHRVSDDLYRGAQPTAEGIRELERLGLRTVVSLRNDCDDRKLMQNSGLVYERIPMTAWHVHDEDIVQFLRTVADERRRPVFVHCRRGADRTGLAVAVYRLAVQGWSKDEAVAEMTQGGFAFYSGWRNLVRYIHDLDVDRLKQRASLVR